MKYIFFLFFAGLGLPTFAQPVLDGSANNPVFGDVFIEKWCDTNGITKGLSGAAVVWNFSSLNQNYSDTVSYQNCISTPYCDSFPISTIVATNAGSYDYYIAGSDKLAITGSFYGGLVYNTKPLVIVSYPFTLYSNSVDTSVYHVYSGSSFVQTTIIDSTTADAYGTLILPSGTHTNVLRIHKIVYSRDSSATATYATRYERYEWYKPGFHSPLLIMRFDTAFGGSPYLYFVVYTKQLAAGIATIGSIQDLQLVVSPNPSAEFLNIKGELLKNTNPSITLLDATGRVIKSLSNGSSKSNDNELNFSIADIPSGFYLLNAKCDTYNFVYKISIVK